MSLWLLMPSLYLAAVCQTSVLGSLLPQTAGPDLFVIVMLAWLYHRPRWSGLMGASITGLASDLVSSGRLGPGLAAAAVLAFVTDRFRGGLGLRGTLAQTLFSLPAAALVASLALAGESVSRGEELSLRRAVPRAAQSVLTTSGTGLPVFLLLARRRPTKRRRSWFA